jgi:phosphate transport system substrate-binding protein
MKRLLKFIPLLLVTVLILSACGGDNNNGGFDTSRNITIIAREDGSGTKSAFMEIIGLKDKPDPANAIIQPGTAAVLAEVKGNPSAIAYESLGYVTDDIKTLNINGIAPTIENILNNTYKIARPLSVVYQESSLDNEVINAFFTFMQSNNAQEIISAEGYVSIIENAPAYTINGSLSGSIDISGSTSVQPLMLKLATAFEDLQPNIKINVSGGGSGTGYNNAEAGVSDFGMISAVFNPENAPSCTFFNVAMDGIAIIVHKNNPLDNITLEQLRNIYDDEVNVAARWSDLINE